jgi:hypothetical protein
VAGQARGEREGIMRGTPLEKNSFHKLLTNPTSKGKDPKSNSASNRRSSAKSCGKRCTLARSVERGLRRVLTTPRMSRPKIPAFFRAVSNPLFAVGIVLAGPFFPTAQIRPPYTRLMR